ncbi:MAG: hypothetical protein KGZ65_09075 [Sphingomonadales bacterium]|nr:hypothetical protein [Sphingomonadaceae bacterium]MBS3931375.1 hypothetical protein [Sphingomonadales bacterium]
MDWQATLALWLDEDWVRFLCIAMGAIAVSVFGWYQERRRKHRSNPDAVPWLPWRDISFWSSFAAVMILIAALQAWLST